MLEIPAEVSELAHTFHQGVEDTGDNIDVDYGHTNVHVDAHTWSDVARRGTIGGRNMKSR